MALFGRKINNAEHQLAFIEMLRLITDGKVSPEEAVRAYHGVLQAKGIKPLEFPDHDAIYSTLAEWANYVMDPAGYSRRRVQAILKRTV